MNNMTKVNFKKIVYLLPAILFCFSIIIVRAHVGSYHFSQFYWTSYDDSSRIWDLFCYYKKIAIYFSTIAAILVIAYRFITKDIDIKRNKIIYFSVAVYSIFVVLSYLLSSWKEFALGGMNDHFQGTIVLLCYMVMLLFIYNSINDVNDVKIIIVPMLCTVLLMNLIGLSQGLNKDIIQTAFGQKLITPYYEVAEGLSSWQQIDIFQKIGKSVYEYTFPNGRAYQTVFNPNFVPQYLCLILPIISFIFIRAFESKNTKDKLLALPMLLLFMLCIYNFFCADSVSGYFGIVAIILTGCVILNKKLLKWIKPLLCIIIVTAIIMVGLADRWTPEIKTMFADTGRVLAHITSSPVYAANFEPSEYFSAKFDNDAASIKANIDYIDTSNGIIRFSINGNEILVKRNAEYQSFEVTDGNEETIVMRMDPDKPAVYELLDTRFHDYVYLKLLSYEDYSYIDFYTSGNKEWLFRYTGETFNYVNAFDRETSLRNIRHMGFEDNYTFGSFRGLIWATTLPLLENYVVLGVGADCFTIAYPQNDYVTQYNIGMSPDGTTLVDKAHNFYLQTWVETGLISLLAWLALVITYFYYGIKATRKLDSNALAYYLNLGILLGVVGFIVTLFFNDGTVNTMPLFYTMLAIGIAITDFHVDKSNAPNLSEEINNVKSMPEM